MLLWVIFLLSSALFGFTIVTSFKSDQIQFINRLFLSWICGSQISGMILFVTTFFFKLTIAHMLYVIAFEIFASIIILLKMSDKIKLSQIFKFEKSYLFYLSLIIPGLFCFPYLVNVYCNLPYSIPDFFISTFESEHSFISSVLHGVNTLRDNFFLFRDPNCFSSFYPCSVIPLLFISGCSVLECPYTTSSIFVCLMNILSTSSFLFFYSAQFTKLQNRFLFVVCFILNGGIEFFAELANFDVTNFLSFQWQHSTAHLLSFSKSASFTIPICIVSLAFIQNKKASPSDLILSLLLSVITPNFMCSLCLFLIASCYIEPLKLYVKFVPVILVRLFFSGGLHVRPLWRESQMEGIFCSQIIIWIISFGTPMFVVLWLLVFGQLKGLLKIFVPNFAAFLFLCFIRNGNDHFNNIVAISSVFLPQLLLVFVISIGRIGSFRTNDKKVIGMMRFFASFLYITYIIGGLLIMLKTFNSSETLVSKSDIEISEVIQKISPEKAVFLAKQRILSPVSFLSGRQIILNNFTSAWKRGVNVRPAMTILNKIESSGDCISMMKKLGIHFLLETKHGRMCSTCEEMEQIFFNEEWELYFLK